MSRSDQVASTPRTSAANGAVVLTVGHSTREQEDFITLLKAYGVKRLVDVRAIPRSRHNPQFNREQIGPALRRAGISYLHMPALGGLRHAKPSSLNTGWRNASFRGFADYMHTRQFAPGAGQTDEAGSARTDRHHVRRGSIVALPSFADCRCTPCPRLSRG